MQKSNAYRYKMRDIAKKEHLRREAVLVENRAAIAKYYQGGKRSRHVGAEEIGASIDAQVAAAMAKFEEEIGLNDNS